MSSFYQPRSSYALQPVPRRRRSGGHAFSTVTAAIFVLLCLGVAGYLAINNAPGPTECIGRQVQTVQSGDDRRDTLSALVDTYVKTSRKGFDTAAGVYYAEHMVGAHSTLLPGESVPLPGYCSR